MVLTASERELMSGSSLSLSCSIQPASVDTPTTIISHWTTPDSIHDTVNDANDTSPQLVVSSAVTADSGNYICSVRVTHSSGSLYILDSPLTSDSVNITISKISVIRASVDALCRDGTSEIS